MLTSHENVTLNCTLKVFEDTDGTGVTIIQSEQGRTSTVWWVFVTPILAILVLLVLIFGVPFILVLIRYNHNRKELKKILDVSPTIKMFELNKCYILSKLIF